ncbi:phage gp6-like head-tail connector protein [Salimicrobium album]|uniref:Phage gp6-like head-tail connector protein n=1 Tax=Salimicrobium album TaxID=50717 RepID=A0A1H3DF07_9BACI|nr:phage gp6-like head-tail connector protein [Salimicrobium album]SDX65072.1 hypothetical protein SAMN04488081_0944 [Salimicrobium album]
MITTITPEILQEFKDRMHISHDGEDPNLKRLLSFSVVAIQGDCGPFDIKGESHIDLQAKELVFERTRYVYNDALEYFKNNFAEDITGLGLDIEFQRMSDEATTTTTTTTDGGV